MCFNRWNATYQAQPFGFGLQPNVFTQNNPAGMQIVPYQQPEPTVNQKIPLTAEQLDNLYKMNYAVKPYSAAASPSVYSYNMQRPAGPAPIFYPGGSSPIAFPTNPPNPSIVPQQQPLQQPQLQQRQPSIESINAAAYGHSMGSTTFSSSSSNTTQQYYNPNVVNPQSALVHVPKVWL